MMRLEAFLLALSISSAHGAEPLIITERPPLPRGGVGTFQQIWAFRVEKDPKPGIASFFDDPTYADGTRRDQFDPDHVICAHPSPSELGQIYRVTRLGKSITCEVRDVGPNLRLNRALDITPQGATYLGITKKMGIAPVWIERLSMQKK